MFGIRNRTEAIIAVTSMTITSSVCGYYAWGLPGIAMGLAPIVAFLLIYAASDL
ncbi:unnamed protein product [marine sediment metagenome]|uniref:Uncharacterized protein n=1 Tax=marine sediment metagenome TaxID=412755 RepID=X0RSC0_9ZZZZ